MALPDEQNGSEEQEGVVIRDNRRIDPETYELRSTDNSPAAEAAAEEQVEADSQEVEELRQELAERTADLQRIQAEYANYRKRVERDRTALRDQTTAQVLAELVPMLDDIGRAREHEELTGGFKSVGESLEAVAARLGLKRYGQEGDTFDPNVHEALTMVPTPGLEVPSILEVFQPGYQVGERVVRPARVVVGGPSEGESDPGPSRDAHAAEQAGDVEQTPQAEAGQEDEDSVAAPTAEPESGSPAGDEGSEGPRT